MEILWAQPARPMALLHAPTPTLYTSSLVEIVIFNTSAKLKPHSKASLWPYLPWVSLQSLQSFSKVTGPDV